MFKYFVSGIAVLLFVDVVYARACMYVRVISQLYVMSIKLYYSSCVYNNIIIIIYFVLLC